MTISVDITLKEKEQLPEYQTFGASGADLKSADALVLLPRHTAVVGTGISVAIPLGYEIQIRTRSGLAAKKNLIVLNSPGTIDADYRGEIKVILYNLSDEPISIARGDRIAQMVLCPVHIAKFNVVESLPETERGEGGFGSTGG